jgi:WD40 repeat protein
VTGSRAGPNPYVGPRPFETGEPLFGRDRELRELLYLLSGERIVLLHSPSGAGKSSLIQAGLIPRLRERFDVWRPTRVGHPPPPDLAADANRYSLSAMLGFEQGIPESLRRPVPALAALRLGEYVATRPRRPGAPEHIVLFFDQFEEVLTADPLAIAAKRAFFAQLGELLQDPRVWVLFSLREDYLAPFDPYTQQVPTHLRNRYRLDMLGLDAAREAIARPAGSDARQWTEPALDRIVGDLAAVKLQQADGSFTEQMGLHIEPMQLQVVCRGLWERMPADDISVDPEDVEAFGNVTHALGTYYAEEVRRIAGQNEAAERALREWVGEKLITSDGIRRPVLRTAGASEGLANEQIGRLVDAHLVRADHRGGATWYELAHDRLVAPLRADNERWAQANLQPVQIQAALWARQGKPAALLLSEEALAEAERWVSARAAPLEEPDHGFIVASRAVRAQERALRDAQAQALQAAQELADAQTRAAARQRRFTQVVGLLLLLSLVAAGFSFLQYREAGRQAARAEEKSLEASEQSNEAKRQAGRARNLWLMSGVRELAQKEEKAQASKLLLEVTDASGWIELAHQVLPDLPQLTLRGHLDRIVVAAWSPDSARLLTASEDRTARVWRADGTGVPRVLAGHEGAVFAEWSPDGTRILTASRREYDPKISLRVWTTDDSGEPLLLTEDEGGLAAWSPDGERIVTISEETGTARVWSANEKGAPVLLMAHEPEDSVEDAAWSPDGAHILLVCRHGIASVWKVDGTREAQVDTGFERSPSAAWSPDGKRIAVTAVIAVPNATNISGEDEERIDGMPLMWEVDRTRSPLVLKPMDFPAVDPDFDFDLGLAHNEHIVTRSTRHAMLWNAEGTLLRVAKGRDERSPNGELSVGIEGNTILVRSLNHGSREPVELDEAHNDPDGLWSPDGRRVLAWSGRRAWLWTPHGAAEPLALKGVDRGIDSAAWSPDGARVVLIHGFTAAVQIWAADGSTESQFRATLPAVPSDCLRVADEDKRGKPIPRLIRNHVLSARWSPDSARVVVITEKQARCAGVWTVDGTSAPMILKGAENLVSASWSPDSSRIAGSSRSSTRIWSADGTGETIVISGHSAEWSPDGSRILVMRDDGTAHIRAADGTGEPAAIAEDQAPIESTSWSPDGRHILVRSRAPASESVLRVWIAAGMDGRTVPESKGAQASWSPDGKRLVVWFSDHRAPRVWSVDETDEPLVLPGYQGPIKTASWSSDGRLILAMCGDWATRLWSTDGTEPLKFEGSIHNAKLSPDNKHILQGNRVWRITVPELREVLERANHDCLSPANRRTYLDEDDAVALERYNACERGYGRVPFFKSARSDEGLVAEKDTRPAKGTRNHQREEPAADAP